MPPSPRKKNPNARLSFNNLGWPLNILGQSLHKYFVNVKLNPVIFKLQTTNGVTLDYNTTMNYTSCAKTP